MTYFKKWFYRATNLEARREAGNNQRWPGYHQKTCNLTLNFWCQDREREIFNATEMIQSEKLKKSPQLSFITLKPTQTVVRMEENLQVRAFQSDHCSRPARHTCFAYSTLQVRGVSLPIRRATVPCPSHYPVLSDLSRVPLSGIAVIIKKDFLAVSTIEISTPNGCHSGAFLFIGVKTW